MEPDDAPTAALSQASRLSRKVLKHVPGRFINIGTIARDANLSIRSTRRCLAILLAADLIEEKSGAFGFVYRKAVK